MSYEEREERKDINLFEGYAVCRAYSQRKLTERFTTEHNANPLNPFCCPNES